MPNNNYQIPNNTQLPKFISVWRLRFGTWNFQRKPNGFSLLELLVVISIITILITLSLSSFATAGKKGRDAKRKNDIKDVQTALEQYYSVCGYVYPDPGGTFYTDITCAGPSIAIMPTVVQDPRGTTPYYCNGTCDTVQYTICAELEAETPSSFCVSNSQ